MLLTMLMTAATTAKTNALLSQAEKISQSNILYHFGTRTIRKDLYIQNIKDNVATFLDYKRNYAGWNYYYIEEFKNAYFRFFKCIYR